jgi:CHAT domain-containing protein
MLVHPLERLFTGREVVFVPCGQLSQVPFPALFDGEQYLTERFTVNHAPGAAVWVRLGERSTSPPKNALLVGFADERIPFVETEIETLKRHLSSCTVLNGESANIAAFVEAAPEFDLIHMACHGQFRGDNPMFSSLHLSDGWITARDISLHKLRSCVVTLSACETGLSQVYAGDETLGLVRGFLIAGASSLIVSLWTVNDSAAVPLMRDLYTELQRGATPAASLQKAQANFIKRGEHPYLWAPFVAIGR